MESVEMLTLSDLMLDMENPRLEVQSSQPDAIRAMVEAQGTKLVKLADDIVANGINRSDLPIVLPTADEKRRYVVLEGNRRIAVLKILSAPEIIAGMVTESAHSRWKKLSADFQKNPIEGMTCNIVEKREDADHWIALKHSGENAGAGMVGWGALEADRFASRRGKKSPQLQVLDFVKQHASLTPDETTLINATPISSLKRLISDPDVRSKLGIFIVDGKVVSNFPQDEVLKGLTTVVKDLASKNIKVDHIKSKEDRSEYIAGLKESQLPTPSKATKEAHTLGDLGTVVTSEASAASDTEPKKRTRPDSRSRTTLIPKKCHLEIDSTRINNIFVELKALNIDSYSNAASVLFRVFMELTLDNFVDKLKKGGCTHSSVVALHEKSKLRDKMDAIAKYMDSELKMTSDQLKAVRKAASKDAILAASIDTMHGYVHNRFLNPSPIDLKTAWDDLQIFITCIWS